MRCNFAARTLAENRYVQSPSRYLFHGLFGEHPYMRVFHTSTILHCMLYKMYCSMQVFNPRSTVFNTFQALKRLGKTNPYTGLVGEEDRKFYLFNCSMETSMEEKSITPPPGQPCTFELGRCDVSRGTGV